MTYFNLIVTNFNLNVTQFNPNVTKFIPNVTCFNLNVIYFNLSVTYFNLRVKRCSPFYLGLPSTIKGFFLKIARDLAMVFSQRLLVPEKKRNTGLSLGWINEY